MLNTMFENLESTNSQIQSMLITKLSILINVRKFKNQMIEIQTMILITHMKCVHEFERLTIEKIVKSDVTS